jgi:hypothetical protein
MLGHLYAAEALVLLDKISDAIEHLNPEHVKELTLMAPPPEKDVDREKADIGTEQQKPLRGEARSSVEDYSCVRSLTDRYRHFTGAYCYQTTQCHIPEPQITKANQCSVFDVTGKL